MSVPLESRHVEALTVAMTIAPGVYSRNRLFDFFTVPGVARAKERAALLRGILRQLPQAEHVTVSPVGAHELVLRYRVPSVRLDRTATLSRVELSCLRVVADDGSGALAATAEDRACVDEALALLQGHAPTRGAASFDA